MISKKTFLTTLSIFFAAMIYSQPFQRLGDINFGTQSSLAVNLNTLTPFASINQYMIFSALDDDYGREPWAYDGTEVYRLMDIYPGESGSGARNFININNKVIFIANDGIHGNEWWVTDGTPEGTHMMIDLSPGISNGVIGSDWNNFYVLHGVVYFNGTHTSGNRELWKTDGTSTGTILVKDIEAGAMSSDPEYFTVFQDKLVFRTNIGVYISDGTEAGTTLVTDLGATELIGLEDRILMIDGDDLIVSDGTPAGTTHLRDFVEFTFFHHYLGPKFRRLGDIALFGADDAIHGHELWRSDGTVEGTYMVMDIDTGIQNATPIHTGIFKGAYYFLASDDSHGAELWKSDGTPQGTHIVKDIKPGSQSGFIERLFTSPDLDFMFLNAADEIFDMELWVSDGTASGTYEININPDGESLPGAFSAYGNKLFFYARDGQHGYEPYVLDPALLTSTENGVMAANSVCLYPNPTKGIVNVGEDVVFDNYILYTMDGVAVRSGKAGKAIDLRGIADGTYVIVLHDTKDSASAVMVVKQ